MKGGNIMYAIYRLRLNDLIYGLNVESYVKNFKNQKVKIFRGGLRECKIKMYFEEFTHSNAEFCLAYNKLDIFKVYEIYKNGKLHKYEIYLIDKD